MVGFSGITVLDPFRMVNFFGGDPAVATGTVRMFTEGSGRVEVDPRLVGGQSTAVIVVIGQSGGASCINTTHTPAQALVHALDISSGRVTQAKDVLLGDTFNPALSPNGQSSLFPRVANTLIVDGKFARVILVPMAVAGSRYAAWASGGPTNPVYPDRGYLRHRFAVVARRLTDKGYTPTLILWVQGVSDASDGTSQANCVTAMQSMITDMRAIGWSCPIFVSKETWLLGSQPAGATAVRAAIDQIIATDATIKLGPDQDLLNDTNRYDGAHWNATGAIAATSAWITKLEAFL